MANINTLIRGLDKLGINITNEQLNMFVLYKELLLKWNKKINITSIEEDDEIDIKHFLDSLSPIKTNLFHDNMRVLDVGTGGGFPAIPLKIMVDNIDMVMIDSLNKRVKFLNEVINVLNLKGTTAIHGRAEDLGQDSKYREGFDVVISRAVASLNVLSEYCLPFAKVGGYFVAMKGKDIEEELKDAMKAINILGGKVEEKVLVEIPESDIIHSLIIIKKISKTPTKYPRQAGKPKKKPL